MCLSACLCLYAFPVPVCLPSPPRLTRHGLQGNALYGSAVSVSAAFNATAALKAVTKKLSTLGTSSADIDFLAASRINAPGSSARAPLYNVVADLRVWVRPACLPA